jgi:nitrate/nitrite-specific signal transduction histidine kinase
VLVELLRYRFFPALDSWTGRVLMDLIVLAGAIFVFGGGFDLLETIQRQLDRQQRELTAIHEGVEEIYGAVSLREVLQKVVDRATELTESRYGTLVLANELHEVTHVVTTGLDAEQRKRLRLRPEGAEILSLALATTEPFRIDDFRRDAPFGRRLRRRLGLRALLIVPLDCKEPLRGRLLVADKKNERPFTTLDQETLVRIATAAALAIDNAQLPDRLRTLALTEERERIGGEIHDGMAQILAHVNAKDQAVSGFMAHGRVEEARGQLDQLATAARRATC